MAKKGRANVIETRALCVMRVVGACDAVGSTPNRESREIEAAIDLLGLPRANEAYREGFEASLTSHGWTRETWPLRMPVQMSVSEVQS
jgi:hypothetical protein